MIAASHFRRSPAKISKPNRKNFWSNLLFASNQLLILASHFFFGPQRMKSKRAQEVEAAAADKPAKAQDYATPLSKKRKRSGDNEVEDSAKKAKKARMDKKEKKEKKKKKQAEKASRKDKKNKRKNLKDLPGEDDNDAEAANGDVNDQPATKETKKKDKSKYNNKKDKKDKEDKHEEETVEKGKKDEEDEKTPKKESKKDKKKTSSSDETTAAAAPEDAIPNGASNGIDLDVEDAGAAATAEDKDDKAARHIVFVGNLPYTATAASISAHFASLSPIAVRCLTQKGGDPSHTCKGIAFVEFANAITQRTCLDRFHHSEFDDGHSPARKINVELTAGGGGKSGHRTEKIREKNRKLDDNRAKRIEKEKAAKNSDDSASGAGGGGGGGGGESGTMEEQQEHMDEQVHPSRRAQMGSDAPPEDNFQNGSGGGGGGRRGGWGGRGRGGGGGRGRGGRGGGGRGRGGRNR
ncbi:hypothetical protein BB8028_0005g11100 [Beauveria bassiana]|uniref:RRM domain-containing protein n=1 Tax=Beauveria bassiana TaxID=176275 RepID=A0A2S7YHG1_BEABA|nr:hypothetical protein BB8028_0005g11100 [Beauveria bassiana]